MTTPRPTDYIVIEIFYAKRGNTWSLLFGSREAGIGYQIASGSKPSMTALMKTIKNNLRGEAMSGFTLAALKALKPWMLMDQSPSAPSSPAPAASCAHPEPPAS